jgi:anti-sigma factor RsiW
MSCRLFECELDAYLDGELNAESSRVIREHLGKCTCCRGRLAERVALASLVRAAPFYSAPDHLRARVLAQHSDRGRFIAPSRADFVGGRRGDGRAVRIESNVVRRREYFDS